MMPIMVGKAKLKQLEFPLLGKIMTQRQHYIQEEVQKLVPPYQISKMQKWYFIQYYALILLSGSTVNI